MDLGFGNANQVLGDATTKALLQSTKAQEDAVDEQMARYDALLESSDDALEELRARRLAQLKSNQSKQQKWREMGHGVYSELGQGQDGRNVAREFFDAAKSSERMVVHFYRPTTRCCDVFHSHLDKLAPKHLETRFVKINVEDCEDGGSGASFLVEKLGIVVMPTLVIVKNRKAIHHIRGFDELGGTEQFSTEALAYVIGAHGGLTPRDDEQEEVLEELKESAEQGVNSIRIHKAGKKTGIRRGDLNDMDDEE